MVGYNFHETVMTDMAPCSTVCVVALHKIIKAQQPRATFFFVFIDESLKNCLSTLTISVCRCRAPEGN